MRGKQRRGVQCNERFRITPARAGKTAYREAHRARKEDHPRACGENQLLCSDLPLPGRITPARAGKTLRPAAEHWRRKDHPRACGENLQSRELFRRIGGSPPRVRGKHAAKPVHDSVQGITPARAGKTGSLGSSCLPQKDHPRACGENASSGTWAGKSRGSPPRVRGKHLYSTLPPSTGRITPARAGKTRTSTVARFASKDHPRACGENMASSNRQATIAGSPPRVRGKLRQPGCGVCAERITPARAGKTKQRRPRIRPHEDHPRACGENVAIAMTSGGQPGSPPRVRGKRIRLLCGVALNRITPARAGKTDLEA